MTGLATAAVDYVHIGPPRHGVTRYGRLLAGEVGSLAPVRQWWAPTTEEAAATVTEARTAPAPRVLHLHYSDWLVRSGTDELIAALTRRGVPSREPVHRRDLRRIVVTLHDLPAVGDGSGSEVHGRRRRYRAVMEGADQVVVSADHEAVAAAALGSSTPVTVIPHLVERRTPPRPDPAAAPGRVTVLGYLYPGKGHDRVLRACGRLRPAPAVRFAGGPAPGHDHLGDELARLAEGLGVPLTMDGWIEEQDLPTVLASASVPVAAHTAPSASGSIATWQSVGRRPVVTPSGYSRYLDRVAPASVVAAPSSSIDGLAGAIARAQEDPPSTWLPAVPPALTGPSVAQDHLSLYARVVHRGGRWR